MKVSLSSQKTTALSGIADIPGDKSISHRSLMFGALASGTTIIDGLLEGEDVLSTANALRAMGVSITTQQTKDNKKQWVVEGSDGVFQQPDHSLDMGNSGTSTRLLMGLVSGYDMNVSFHGDASLSKRPMKRITTPLNKMGVSFTTENNNCLPITVTGNTGLTAIKYELPIASAQVKSAIILAALKCDKTTTIIENKPTRDHSERMLTSFGANIQTEDLKNGGKKISIIPPHSLTGQNITVPSDPSSAAFPIAAALLCEGSDITVPNICLNPTRTGFYDTIKDMGADITFENQREVGGETVADLHIRYKPLTGVTIPVEHVPSMIDEFPIISVLASCAKGTTYMTGLNELRVKECDRLSAMATGLNLCGVNLIEGEDSLTINGTGVPPVGGETIETHLDHRIAMSFLVLGCATKNSITIDDKTPIMTSFPNFIPLMTELGCLFE